MTCFDCLCCKECAKQEKTMLIVDGIGEYVYQRNVEKDCLNFLDGDAALDLIKRQQALIEELRSIVFKQEEDKQKAQAEIESLKAIKCFIEEHGEINLYPNIEKIKSAARKEFAERLKEKKYRLTDFDEAGFSRGVYAVEVEYIDNLLKELDGKENSDER